MTLIHLPWGPLLHTLPMGQEPHFNSAQGLQSLPSYVAAVPLSSPISWVDLGPVFPVLFLAPSPAALVWTLWLDLVPGSSPRLAWVCQWIQPLLPALPALLRHCRTLPRLVRDNTLALATPRSSSCRAVPLCCSPRLWQNRCPENWQQQDSSGKQAIRQKPEMEAFAWIEEE